MRIGYACKCEDVEGTNIRSCILKNASEEKLKELIAHNFSALMNILQYNIAQGIPLFRISSDLIPFGSLPINQIPWWDLYREEFYQIEQLVKAHNLRLSMHPGQYTIINALNPDVVARAVADLEYHAKILDTLHLGQDSKMVLHIGGVYGDKEAAIQRFIETYEGLSDEVKRHLVIEHDDRLFDLGDVLRISDHCHIPVIFDNLHNEILPYAAQGMTEMDWLMKCRATWEPADGIQKIHYANQEMGKRIGSHSQTINTNHFLNFIQKLPTDEIDIMLEVKDKNHSAVRLIPYLDHRDFWKR